MSKQRPQATQSKNTVARYKLVIDEYYNNGCDGSAAYMRIYQKARKKTASISWNKIKNDSRVKDYIKEKQESASRKIEMTHAGILQELKNWIESDVTDFLGLTIEQIKLLPVEIRRYMKGHKVTEKETYNSRGEIVAITTTITMTFESKSVAMDMVNKHIGFYEKDNTQKTPTIDLKGQTTSELLARAAAIKAISKNE